MKNESRVENKESICRQKFKTEMAQKMHLSKRESKKEVLRFALKGLEPDSLYFLQVQAMSQFGRDRLKSEKAAIFLNTSDHKKVNEVTTPQTTTINHRSARGADELKVQQIFWSQDQLLARLIWQPPYRTGVFYSVSWQVGSCQNGVPVARKSLLTGTTNIPEFDVYGLNFNCKYLVTVREVTSDNTTDPYKTVLQFITPSCKTFIRRNHYEKILCSSSDSRSK